MMQDAKNGKFDMIAVWKIDRLSRNLSHLLSTFETLQNHKVGFFSLKENIDFT
jgi:site-specific DNA recombinase